MTEQNLVPLIDRLTKNEKAVICLMCNESRLFQGQVHQGRLPFLPLKRVLQAVVDDWRVESRLRAQILSKLRSTGEDAAAHFSMHLNAKKVLRFFGRDPSRGKPINIVPKERVTVGVKWSLPKKTWLPDRDVLVAPVVALRWLGNKDGTVTWLVTAPAKHKQAVIDWLMQNCR